MSGYAALAAVYDRLTGDVDYDRRAERLLALFARHRRRPDTLLDLACGTGSLALRFAAQGIERTCADGETAVECDGALRHRKCRAAGFPEARFDLFRGDGAAARRLGNCAGDGHAVAA